MRSPFFRHALAAGLLDCALVIGYTAAPFYIFNQLHGGAQMSGNVAGIQAICYATACLLSAGFVGRVRNAMRWSVVGTLAFAFFWAVSPLVRHPAYFVATTLGAMLAMSLIWPAMQAWLGLEEDPKRRARRIVVYNISWSIGLAVGPLIAGPLYDRYYLLPFGALLVFAVAAALLIQSLPQEHLARHKLAAGSAPPPDLQSERYLYTAWLANSIGWILMGATRSILPKRVDELVDAGRFVLLNDGHPIITYTQHAATAFAWLAFAVSAVRAVTFLAMGFTDRWRYRFDLMLISQLASVGALWLLGTSNSLTVMFLACAIVGINGGIGFFASLYYSIANPAYGHRRAAIHETAVGLGNFTGSMVFGFFAERYGTSWPFLHAMYPMLALIVVQLLLLQYGTHRLKLYAVSPKP